jgi:hypothetical protein
MNYIVGAIVATIPVGIGLALYFDNLAWLALSLIGVILLAAG